jgi:dipeptidyl aminopeptidase/acylaminoacyl peptidase
MLNSLPLLRGPASAASCSSAYVTRRSILQCLSAALLLGATGCDAPPWSGEDVLSPTAALLKESPAIFSISPDGKQLLLRVASETAFELAVMDRASGRIVARHRTYTKQLSPSWRPDGQAIAFFSSRGGKEFFELLLWDLRTSKTQFLGVPTTPRLNGAQWAPDGNRLAYIVGAASGMRHLYVVHTSRPGSVEMAIPYVAPKSDIAWSPDGQRVAAVSARERGTVIIAGGSGGVARVRISPGSEVRGLAWSEDSRSILATRRRKEDEFFRLVEVDLRTSRIQEVNTGAGDVSMPRYLPRNQGLAYHVNVDSELQAYSCTGSRGSCRALGTGGGSSAIVGLSPAGDSAYLIFTARAASPSMHAVALDGTGSTLVYRPPQKDPAEYVAGQRVDIQGPDGTVIPTYVWRSRRVPGRKPTALLRVHGGPALQATRLWNASIQHAVRTGFDVIVPNYRGSTGYGAGFEHAPGGDMARVKDILAARDYAVNALGVPPGRVILYGHSYGALLVAKAAETDAAVDHVLLLSMIRDRGELSSDSRPRRRRTPVQVVAFHGTGDHLPAEDARTEIAGLLGEAAPGGARHYFRVLADEGHAFEWVGSWAEVHTAIEWMRRNME